MNLSHKGGEHQLIYMLPILLMEGLVCYVTGCPAVSADLCEVISIILLCINTIFSVLILIRKRGTDSRLTLALLLAYFFRLFLLIYDRHICRLPNSGADTESFNAQAVNLLRYGTTPIDKSYSYFLCSIYYFFGIQRTTAQYFNLIFGLVFIDVLYGILTKLKFSKKTKRVVTILAAFLPYTAIQSVILLRESIITLLLALSIYQFVVWWFDRKQFSLVLSILLSLLAATFHTAACTVAIGAITLLAFTQKTTTGNRNLVFKFSSLIVLIAGYLAFAWLFNNCSSLFFSKLSGINTNTGIINYLMKKDAIEIASIGSTSTYIASITDKQGLFGFVLNSPVRILYFLMSPMPWNWRGLPDIITFIFDSVFYGVSFLFALRAIVRQRRNRGDFTIAIFIIMLFSVFLGAWGCYNAGTAMRHREKFLVLFLIAFASFFENELLRKQQTRSRGEWET